VDTSSAETPSSAKVKDMSDVLRYSIGSGLNKG
jgi:hypothetical protein